MGLVISVAEGEHFNIGHHRFVVEQILPGDGCIIREFGGATCEVTQTNSAAVNHLISVIETPRASANLARLRIDAPEALRIWRGEYDSDAELALLAPIPAEHLISGREVCTEMGRVAFGTRAFEVFRELDMQLRGSPCNVLIYASHAAASGPPRISWRATYLRTLEVSHGIHPDGLKYRPPTTQKYPADNKGYWAAFWELTDLRPLVPEHCLPIAKLRGQGKNATYRPTFRPEGPILIDPF